MLAQFLLASDLPWQVATPFIGLASAGLTLYLGRLLIRPRFEKAGTLAPPTGADKPEEKFDPFIHGSANEKRTAHRRRGNPVQIFISDAEATRPPELGWVVD